ncbi:putative C2 domain-containing protein [Helianthus annuus]|nr:putative prolycopenC2 and GRAM domain-containing protein [Helianthus annuus]KAJ0920187.1 putative C2 domain-containing protein [Helianthus annuus]
MIMKLYVYVLEGKDWAVEESYVKLKVGKFKSRTRVLKNTRNPVWNEEFVFRVDCLDDDELVVSVYDGDGDDESSGLFKVNSCRSLVGRVRIPLWSVAAEEDHHLQPTWFSVQSDESNESIEKACG